MFIYIYLTFNLFKLNLARFDLACKISLHSHSALQHIHCPSHTLNIYKCAHFLKIFLFYFFRERGREGEGEGEKCLWKRETLMNCLSHVPGGGLNPQPNHVP